MATQKPALASTTIWGGLIALAGSVWPFLPQAVQFIPAPWQPIATGIITAIGGIVAIYGRVNPNIAPIQGIIRSP